MKKFILCLLVIAMAAGICACGAPAAPAATPTPEIIYVTPDPETTPVPKKLFEGTIKAFDTGSITVENNTNTWTFVINGDTIVNGTLANGSDVDVTYTGVYTDQMPADQIVVTAAATPAPTGEVQGDVLYADNESTTISTTSGVYTFVINDDTYVSYVPFDAGDYATVTYKGDLNNNPVATRIDPIHIVVTPKPAPVPVPTSIPDVYNQMDGWICDMLMSTVTINLNNGAQVQILKDYTSGDVQIGSRCTVYFKGYTPTANSIYSVFCYGAEPDYITITG